MNLQLLNRWRSHLGSRATSEFVTRDLSTKELRCRWSRPILEGRRPGRGW